MTLGALFDLGVPEKVVREAIAAMGLDAERLRAAGVVKGGIAATDVKVSSQEGDDSRSAGHRHYSDIREQIEGADLHAEAKRLALGMFARIGRAEAKLHGSTLESVHFHEVGAIDSIVDVVGTAAALAWLAPSTVTCRAVAVGQGTVRCDHGLLPVPAPATLEILREVAGVLEGGNLARELCTPTGAAILAEMVTEWTGCPELTPVAVGYGAGDAELADRPNVVRVVVGKRSAATQSDVVVIEANIDDMTPEQAAYVSEQLLATGALDAWWSPIVMKKSRPAFQLGVLARAEDVDALSDLVLRESTTLGVRLYPASRRVLEREVVSVDTEFGELAVVVARRGAEVLRAAPEHEPCRKAALEHGVPLAEVYRSATRAYWSISPKSQ